MVRNGVWTVIELKNDDLRVKVNEHGAELSSVQSIDDGIEYMWQADSKFWGRHAPILFPIVGRLKDDQYTVNGKTYAHQAWGCFDMDLCYRTRDDHVIFS